MCLGTLQMPRSALSQVPVSLLAMIPTAHPARAPGGQCQPSRSHLECPLKAPDVSAELCGLLTKCPGSLGCSQGASNLSGAVALVSALECSPPRCQSPRWHGSAVSPLRLGRSSVFGEKVETVMMQKLNDKGQSVAAPPRDISRSARSTWTGTRVTGLCQHWGGCRNRGAIAHSSPWEAQAGKENKKPWERLLPSLG